MVYLGLPIKNGGFFHGYVSHNQMVVFWALSKLQTELAPQKAMFLMFF